jgi:thiol-disulfide isomerase/thioredoxin
MPKRSKIIWGFVGLAFLAGLVWLVFIQPYQPDKYDDFASCISEKGAVFYGAFWCPHCQSQKAAFGRSERFLKYVECSTPDSQGQTKICADKGIKSYPTWEFADGSREYGEISMDILARKTGCILPQ